MDKSSRQIFNKETLDLTYILNQMSQTYISKTFYPAGAEHTFISSTHGKFSMVYHMLGLKTSLNTFKKSEIISCILSDHNCMK